MNVLIIFGVCVVILIIVVRAAASAEQERQEEEKLAEQREKTRAIFRESDELRHRIMEMESAAILAAAIERRDRRATLARQAATARRHMSARHRRVTL